MYRYIFFYLALLSGEKCIIRAYPLPSFISSSHPHPHPLGWMKVRWLMIRCVDYIISPIFHEKKYEIILFSKILDLKHKNINQI